MSAMRKMVLAIVAMLVLTGCGGELFLFSGLAAAAGATFAFALAGRRHGKEKEPQADSNSTGFLGDYGAPDTSSDGNDEKSGGGFWSSFFSGGSDSSSDSSGGDSDSGGDSGGSSD